jgi:hypothetical protein
MDRIDRINTEDMLHKDVIAFLILSILSIPVNSFPAYLTPWSLARRL